MSEHTFTANEICSELGRARDLLQDFIASAAPNSDTAHKHKILMLAFVADTQRRFRMIAALKGTVFEKPGL